MTRELTSRFMWTPGFIELGRRMFGVIWDPETATDDELRAVVNTFMESEDIYV